MKRTQIQLDDSTYEALRRRAREQQKSIPAVAREILAGVLKGRKKEHYTLADFSFVGSGRSAKTPQDVSARHDEVLAEIWSGRQKK